MVWEGLNMVKTGRQMLGGNTIFTSNAILLSVNNHVF